MKVWRFELYGLGLATVENRVSVPDWHAILLHLLGLKHDELFVEEHGLKEKLTGVNEARIVKEILLVVGFAMLAVSLILNLIVAVGNWHLYSRVEQVETILGLVGFSSVRRIPPAAF
ncbi:MAG: DUF1501 domain-containing protein [Verrucomicrobia bacterium]|nr:DUF1501 domain-containing protein [Verrucomicrobiota bacterium]